MDTIADLFDHLGGPSGVARVLSVGASTASEMKRRRSIPVRYWPSLIESEKGQEVGLSSEILMRLHSHQASENAA